MNKLICWFFGHDVVSFVKSGMGIDSDNQITDYSRTVLKCTRCGLRKEEELL